ncbi:ABC transporter permease [Dactylosporangium sp. CA-139066]|uniref:ABC transporter permease n=1 Tax=Dactylosporangium sp. CA-139066 TaxID=3239930 RepID=UPI003D8F498B
MLRAAVRWLVSSVTLLFVVTGLSFVLVSLAPGDAATSILSSQSGTYTPEQYARTRELLGIDEPLHVRYWHWLRDLFHGSLGQDLFSGQPVAEIVGGRLLPSLAVIAGTVGVSAVVGTWLGVAGARRSGALGKLVDAASLVGLAVPSFWLALLMVELFAVRLAWLPAGGYVDPGRDPAGWLRSIVLPVLTLSAGAIAFVAKQTRDSMATVLDKEFVTMLRARGLPVRSILYKHALRNAAVPVVTMLGLLFVNLLSGAVLIEGIFAVPGLGQQAVTASGSHNLPVITGVAFCFTVVVVTVNLLVDLAYRWLDPKVRAA